MASVRPPLMSLCFLFYRRGDPIHIIIERYSYTVVCHPETRCWYFESECYLEGEDTFERKYDCATTYPEPLCERLRRAAEFVRAYYEVDVDERVGTAAFDRMVDRDVSWQ